MELTLYLILVANIILWAILTIAINKKRIELEQKHNWLKYFTYLFIVHVLFVSILFNTVFFHYLSIVVICFGYFEIIRLIFNTKKVRVGITSLVFFSSVFYAYLKFSFLDQKYLFYVLLLVTVFDAFSQLRGQFLDLSEIYPINQTYFLDFSDKNVILVK